MSGRELVVDTNIIILTLGGNERLADYVEGRKLFISVITEIEALSYPGLSKTGQDSVEAYIGRCTVLGLSERIKREAIRVRMQYKEKLPDAFIAATAIAFERPLPTADQGFVKLGADLELDLFQFTA